MASDPVATPPAGGSVDGDTVTAALAVAGNSASSTPVSGAETANQPWVVG